MMTTPSHTFRRSAFGPPVTGFVIGLLASILISILVVFLAVSGEKTVRTPIASTTYIGAAKGFEMTFEAGVLAYLLPLIGLFVGGAVVVLRRRARR